MYKLLHKLPAETAHNLAIWALSNELVPSYTPPAKEVKLFGLTFANPLGMAAGFDKNAKAIDGLFKLGFGFVEVGTVTPRPQKGNPKPRLFRLTPDSAIINRLGFNNLGIEEFLKNFARHKHQGIVGINIGANKDSADMMEDYMVLIEKTAPLADYITINISSPNTPGLRDLQKKEAVHVLLSKIKGIHESQKRKPPLLVKIAPDLEDDAVYAVAEVALQLGIDGIIATNTTIARPALKSANASQQGGLSGKPLTAKSTDVIKKIHSHTSGKLPIIGVGGVFNKQDYDDKIAAGASLVQVYTGLIYQGPNIVKNILG
jgi:dihydroorotate dehydrogenase